MKSRSEATFPYFGINDYFEFPHPETATESGIVASGGNLSPGMLFSAYLQGIFPWFSKGDPVLWWSPSPRFVFFPQELHIPTSLKRFLKNNPFTFDTDAAFKRVITHCAKAQRPGQRGTWITGDVIKAYIELHRLGYAHSFETYLDGELAGGFYGILIGRIFFGESMFTLEPEASKAAFCRFAQIFLRCGGALVDSQVYTDHVARFGGKNISREVFLRLEQELLPQQLEKDLFAAFRTLQKV